jgi:hypothetical protein
MILPIRAHPSTQFERMAAMFTRISNTLAGVLARISHGSVKHHDPDIRLLENDPAALAYLQIRPHHDPDICLFENDPAAQAYFPDEAGFRRSPKLGGDLF